MYSTFNSFDLQSSWTSITVPSGGTQWEAHQQGHIQGLSLIRITPLIWIKILEASWLTGFNHFDVPLKPASLLLCAKQSAADLRRLLCKKSHVCFFFFLPSQSESVWQDVPPLWSNIHVRRVTYRRKRAFLSPCSSPGSSRPCTRTCRRPPVGSTGFPGRRWPSSCPPSWGTVRRPLSSSWWRVQGWKIRGWCVLGSTDKTSSKNV